MRRCGAGLRVCVVTRRRADDPAGDLYNARQQVRFMRPDAARYIRPDVSRWLTPPLSVAQSNATEAVARIRELDPGWSPPQSAYHSPEGLIRAYQADAAAAQVRASELAARGAMPGPFAGESILARGPGYSITSQAREELNRIGSETGCHTCGRLNSGTPSGNFFADHQFPTRINPEGRAQRLYPQCRSCSARQGPFVRDLQK